MRISVDVITQAYKSGSSANALSMCVLIKSIYRNSTIYNYKSKDAVELMLKMASISRNTYFRYIQIGLSMGWLVEHNGNLTVRRLNNGPKGGEFLTLSRNRYMKSLRSIGGAKKGYILIQAENLTRIAYKQKAIIKVKDRANTASPSSLHEYKKSLVAQKALHKFGYEMSGQDNKFNVNREIQFTVNNISERLSLSRHRFYNVRRFMTSNGALSVRPNIELVGQIKKNEVLPPAPEGNYFVSKKGMVYLRKCNSYSFSNISISI